MRKFKVNVEGETFEVEVEELGGAVSRVAAERERLREIVKAQPSAPLAPPPAKPSPPPVASAPVSTVPVSAEKAVLAPMPGSIISVYVKVGGEVKQGDILVSIDSMKVQNEIRAPRDGKVKEVFVSEGTYVKTKQALVALE